MKRKLIAIFAACITLTCALASCGDTDESESEKSSRKKNSSSDVSDKDDIDDEDSDDDNDDDDDKKEKTTSASDDDSEGDDVTEPDKDDDSDFGNSDEAIGGDITGYWEMPDEGDETIAMGFGKNGNGSVFVDATSIMYFTSDQKLCMEGMEFDAEFDGKTITVTANPSDFGEPEDTDMDLTILTLERTGNSDASGLDGEYSLTGGMMGEVIISSFAEEFSAGADIPVYMVIDGENFGIKLDNLFTYSTSGNILAISGLDAISDELDGMESGEVPYSVNGDELTIFDDNGDIIIMTRFEY
ncbi:MAG: hypothetical protein NC485_11855 [Ruminococcus flavefaciens]|nr:hypothetical protein [Ruminococcus flavefaciens]MCM1061243.1 hypothetical protein [Eubacterium sp.]